MSASSLTLKELIERLQECHAKLGNHPEVRVRFESAGYLDDEGGTNLSETEIEYIQRLVVIR